ncbi:hypothetical protein N9K16_05745, partial [Alphaproteobacteria bacterium]|nr:hypothetical protein [Alphaproteobacteria bacterium]
MNKIKYLIGCGKSAKLKRKIPEQLQILAGKKNWVESVGSLSFGEQKIRAARFTSWTDQEVLSLKKQPPTPNDEPQLESSLQLIELTDHQVYTLANQYYRDQDHQLRVNGWYENNSNIDYADDPTIDAISSLEYLEHSGIWGMSKQTETLLQKNGLLSPR